MELPGDSLGYADYDEFSDSIESPDSTSEPPCNEQECLHALFSLAQSVVNKINRQLRDPSQTKRLLWVQERTRGVRRLCADASSLLEQARHVIRSTSMDYLTQCPLTVFGCNKVITLSVTLVDGNEFHQQVVFRGAQSVRRRKRAHRGTAQTYENSEPDTAQKSFNQKVSIPVPQVVWFEHLAARKGTYMALNNMFGRAQFFVTAGEVESAVLTSPDGIRMHYVGGRTQTLYLRNFCRREAYPECNVGLGGYKQLTRQFFGRLSTSNKSPRDKFLLTFVTSDKEVYRVSVNFIYNGHADHINDEQQRICVAPENGTECRTLDVDLRPPTCRQAAKAKAVSLMAYISRNNSSQSLINVSQLLGDRYLFCCPPVEPGCAPVWFTHVYLSKLSIVEHFAVHIASQKCPTSISVNFIHLHLDSHSGELCSSSECCAGN